MVISAVTLASCPRGALHTDDPDEPPQRAAAHRGDVRPANGLPLYTTNPGDFSGLGRLLAVVPFPRPPR